MWEREVSERDLSSYHQIVFVDEHPLYMKRMKSNYTSTVHSPLVPLLFYPAPSNIESIKMIK